MKVAAIDCGTNSVRLLIAKVGSDGKLVDLDRRLELVRLGQGVDATGAFAREALERAFATFSRYAKVIESHCCDRIRFVATSAARDATNREEFFAEVKNILGVEAEIISGDEEARLSFSGAISRLKLTNEPILVTDTGGGSTELVLGTKQGEIISANSINIGSVRIRERFLFSDPPKEEQILQAKKFISTELAATGIDFSQIRTWIGVAGTITSMSAINLGLTSYDPEKIHGSVMSQNEISTVTNRLLLTPVKDIVAEGLLPPRRAEIICAGALIVDSLAGRVQTNLLVSESDILDGIGLSLAKSSS